jgi:hypothetical protein
MQSNIQNEAVTYSAVFQSDIEMHYPDIISAFSTETHSLQVLLVGAWRGDEVHSFLRWKNLGHVYAFEPNPESYAYISTAFAGNKKVSCFNVACGDYDGMATLHKHNTTSGTESLLPSKALVVLR